MLSYDNALTLYTEKNGFPANKHWKALLYLATSCETLWDLIWPVININEGVADLQEIDLNRLSSGQRLLVKTAKELYNWGDSVSLTDAADTLDKTYWKIFLNAILIYRGSNTVGAPCE